MKHVLITFLVVDKKKTYKRNIRKNRFEAHSCRVQCVTAGKSWQQEVKATIIQSGSRQQASAQLPLPPPT